MKYAAPTLIAARISIAPTMAVGPVCGNSSTGATGSAGSVVSAQSSLFFECLFLSNSFSSIEMILFDSRSQTSIGFLHSLVIFTLAVSCLLPFSVSTPAVFVKVFTPHITISPPVTFARNVTIAFAPAL